jgi:hypothetical protein
VDSAIGDWAVPTDAPEEERPGGAPEEILDRLAKEERPWAHKSEILELVPVARDREHPRRREAIGLLRYANDRMNAIRALSEVALDPEDPDQDAAIRGLGDHEGPTGPARMKVIARVARDPRSRHRAHAIVALWAAAWHSEMVLEALTGEEHEYRDCDAVRAVIRELFTGEGEDAVLGGLGRILTQGDESASKHAAEVLGAVAMEGHGRALDLLLDAFWALDGRKYYVASTELGVLAGSGLVPALGALTEVAESGHPWRRTAIHELGTAVDRGSGAAVEVLARIALDQQDPHREMAIKRLEAPARNGQREATEALARILLERADPMRERALRLLGSAGRTRNELGVRALLRVFDCADDPLRPKSVDALAQVASNGIRGAIEAMIHTIQNRADPDRETAIGSLGRVSADDPETLGVLLRVARDPLDPHRDKAIETLYHAAGTGRQEAIELLLSIARDRGDKSRPVAIEALWVAARDVQGEALDLLLEIVRDREDPAREVAIRALAPTARSGREEPLRTMVAIGQDAEDPGRIAVTDALRELASLANDKPEVREAYESLGLNPYNPTRRRLRPVEDG